MIQRLILAVEQQMQDDFTHNEPMKRRVVQYRRWLRELEAEAAA